MPAHRRPHRLVRVLAAGVTAAALATPPAVARPIDGPQDPVPSDPDAVVAVAPEQAPARSPVVQTVDDGFDWGSAAIGAGGAGGLVVVAALGSAAYATRHQIGVPR
jgi:hypothetical protein